MRSIRLLLSVFAALLTVTVAAAPATFSVAADKARKTGANTWSFRVDTPEHGVYRAVVYGAAASALAQGAPITVYLEDGVRKHRMVIQPGQPQGRIDAIRVDFNGKPRTLTVESPAAAITKIDFVPLKSVAVPSDAVAYRPRVTPPATHPRVLVNAAMLPALRKSLDTDENRPVWEKVQAVARAPYRFEPGPDEEVHYIAALLSAARCKAFYYLITGDQTIGRDAVSLVRRYLTRVDYGVAQDITREIGEGLYTAGLVYDWCYPLLTAEDKESLIERFYYFAFEMETGWPPFKEPALYGHANEAQIGRDQLAAAIAIYDEDPQPYRYIAYCLLEVSAPAKNFLYRSGRHDQGTSYGNYRFCWGDLHAELLFRRMNGHRLFSDDMARVPYRWIYLRTPDGKLFKEGDDFFTVGDYTGNDLMNFIAASLFGDATLKAEYQAIDPSGNLDPVFFLCVNDPELKAADRRAELPLSCFYPSPLGGMVARTGWNFGLNSDDVIVSMLGAGYHYRNHQHLDAGSFQIYYRGPLLSDLGLYRGYGNPFDWNFHKSTVSHSAMLIRDPEQQSYPMGPRFKANSGTQEVTDFIPAPSLGAQLNGDYYRNGEVTAAGFGPDRRTPEYTFLKTDLALSYASRVDAYVRTLVFLNLGLPGTPALLISNDALKLKADRIVPAVQLTGPVRPEVNGATLTFTNRAYGRTARLTVETLLPRKSAVELLSGRDVYTIDGKKYLPGGFYDFASSGTRAMVTAASGEPRDRFLQVMQIQDGSVAPLPVAWDARDNRHTVRVADRLVDLAGDGLASAGAVSFKLDRETRVLVLDLVPGGWTLEGPQGRSPVNVAADTGSFFAVLPAGNYRLAPETAASPAAVTPAPAANALYLDDVQVPAKLIRESGTVLLPFKSLLKAARLETVEAANRLSFRSNGETVVLEDGKAAVSVGAFSRPLPVAVRKIAGEWYVPMNTAAALLEALPFADRWNGSVLLKSRPEAERTKFWLTECTAGDPAAWRQLWETTRGKWTGRGRVVGEAILRQPEDLAGLEILRGDAPLRNAKLKIEVSADGSVFRTVFDGQTALRQIAYEKIPFAPQTVRMIRVTFDGNTENDQNGLLGLKLVSAKGGK